ncbi:Hsp70 family protein [Pedobacter changchengzhani]|uniref:Hsp70 family protein n=1 Tax=Pedobacter changchengzhani TaxID=2529274 RepID=A0A4R5MP35_9SPHI|nr:Hsp70 family protein [Pedobacter changchengzhani]TDG37551.1 Hsp70 family protein [Pedobacter changchengzhani]
MRNKIDYGIDLGTTNSAIARMENGKPKIIQTDLQKDTMPSSVAVNPRKNIIVGDAAYAANIKDKLRLLKTFGKDDSSSYIEFKRTMGKDVKYRSSLLDKDFTSEELSAEVLKKLKSFVTDEQIKSIVITVPAMFTMAQNEATMNAARLAGFEVIELLQEPIAASIAYGLDSKEKNGKWLVFDFGGGTFDAALVTVDEGIMKVLDTDGNNELGGKDLDLAIVDAIILPYLKENYSIEGILADKDKREILRNAMKSFAEKAKIDLSFNSSTDITCFPDEIGANDEDGNELALSIDINQEDLEPVFQPIFQKAIDITKEVLLKKNLKGKDIDCIILVGGPTYSPILQQMLKDQITDKVIAKNQMTSVATGAAIYASTKDIGMAQPAPPSGTIALDLKYESATVDEDTLINIKINSALTTFNIPEKVFATIERGDKAYSSNKTLISDKKATLIEVLLNQNDSNYFSIILTDEKGDRIPCEPNNLTITDIHIPSAPLPYHIGVQVWDSKKEITVFKGLKGLEKNQILKGAVGITPQGLKTPKQLTAGKVSDVLRIPIFQGSDGAEGKNSFQSNFVTEVVITGESIPRVVPANSDVEITLTFDSSGAKPICSVFFPVIDYTEEVDVEFTVEQKVAEKWLHSEINSDIKRAEVLLGDNHIAELDKCLSDLELLKADLKNESGSEDGKMKILNSLRKIRNILDNYEADIEWPKAESELKTAYYDAEELIEKIDEGNLWGNINEDRVRRQLNEFKVYIETILKEKDIKLANEVKENINNLMIVLFDQFRDEGDREKGYIEYIDENFSDLPWKDANKARQLTNQALTNINTGGSLSQLEQLCVQINNIRDRNNPNQPDGIPKI